MNKFTNFWRRHWIDVLVILAVAAGFIALFAEIFVKFKFSVKLNVFYNYFIVNEGYKDLLDGMKNTAIIAVLGLVFGIVLGTIIAVVKVIPSTSRIARYAKKVVAVYVAFFRGTPLVVQLLVGFYILFPLLSMKVPPVVACVTIFSLNSAAYISEIMRSGIQSVDPGQLEAARAVGLPYGISMLKVVVPQAVKNILPTLGNEFIALVKETAVVGYVGALDITTFFQYQGANTYEYMIPYLVMAVLYIVIVALIAWGVRVMERSLRKNERSK